MIPQMQFFPGLRGQTLAWKTRVDGLGHDSACGHRVRDSAGRARVEGATARRDLCRAHRIGPSGYRRTSLPEDEDARGSQRFGLGFCDCMRLIYQCCNLLFTSAR